MSEGNQPETYLTPRERQQLQRLLGFPEEFPQKFIAWLDDHLRVNVPQFPVTHVKGFQDFFQTVQQFMLGQSGWDFIDAKGDLVVGFADNVITVLSASADGYVLMLDETQDAGMLWVPQSAITAASGAGGSGGKFEIMCTNPNASASPGVGDGKGFLLIPADLDGMNLVHAHAFWATVGADDAQVQIHNVTQAADMLSTKITIDSAERSSYTAATPPVIDTSNDDVAEGDLLRVDLDNAAADAKGLGVILHFE